MKETKGCLKEKNGSRRPSLPAYFNVQLHDRSPAARMLALHQRMRQRGQKKMKIKILRPSILVWDCCALVDDINEEIGLTNPIVLTPMIFVTIIRTEKIGIFSVAMLKILRFFFEQKIEMRTWFIWWKTLFTSVGVVNKMMLNYDPGT